jgi:hypothetical protein
VKIGEEIQLDCRFRAASKHFPGAVIEAIDDKPWSDRGRLIDIRHPRCY